MVELLSASDSGSLGDLVTAIGSVRVKCGSGSSVFTARNIESFYGESSDIVIKQSDEAFRVALQMEYPAGPWNMAGRAKQVHQLFNKHFGRPDSALLSANWEIYSGLLSMGNFGAITVGAVLQPAVSIDNVLADASINMNDLLRAAEADVHRSAPGVFVNFTCSRKGEMYLYNILRDMTRRMGKLMPSANGRNHEAIINKIINAYIALRAQDMTIGEAYVAQPEEKGGILYPQTRFVLSTSERKLTADSYAEGEGITARIIETDNPPRGSMYFLEGKHSGRRQGTIMFTLSPANRAARQLLLMAAENAFRDIANVSLLNKIYRIRIEPKAM